MKTIPLTKGYETIVNDEDFDRLTQWSWCFAHGYAFRSQYIGTGRADRKSKAVLMHREILAPLPGFDVDHINGNKLDNRRENLRICTHRQNLYNSKLSVANKSGFRGVCWDKARGSWIAQIRLGDKPLFLGKYETKEEAALAYNAAALRYRGNFAKLNAL